MKRTLALTLSLLMLAAALAGCANASPSPTTAPTAAPAVSAAATATVAPTATAENWQIAAIPAKITLFYAFGGNGAPTGDMPIWKEAAKITGVTMENVANPSISDDIQSLNTMLASGSLPDLIQGQFSNINPIIAQGALIPLDDLIGQYAPNIKKFFNDYPDAVAACTGPDGKIYDVTGTLGGDPGQYLPSMAFFIRKDWLDKLNLPVPTTLQQYKDALYAFRNQDPNGNGKKDEIPYLYRDKGISGLYQLFGVGGEWGQWFITADNTVQFGQMTTEYKNAIKELSQWYADGVIDPEIYTRGSQARQDLLGNNLGGSTIDWLSSTASMNTNTDILANVPKINFVAIAPPADINGKVKQLYSRAPITTYCWGISKDCKDPATAIRYMDFWFSDVGETLMNWGIEGQTYTMVDGKPQFTQTVFTNPAGVPNYMRSIGSYEVGHRGDIAGELAGMNDIAKAGYNLYLDNNYCQPPFPNLSFTQEETDTINNAMGNISTYQAEWEQKCITGVQKVDDSWDAYITEMNNMGMQQVLTANNAAYQRYVASTKAK